MSKFKWLLFHYGGWWNYTALKWWGHWGDKCHEWAFLYARWLQQKIITLYINIYFFKSNSYVKFSFLGLDKLTRLMPNLAWYSQKKKSIRTTYFQQFLSINVAKSLIFLFFYKIPLFRVIHDLITPLWGSTCMHVGQKWAIRIKGYYIYRFYGFIFQI